MCTSPLWSIGRAASRAALGVSAWLLPGAGLLAAAIDEEQKTGGGASWAVSYMLVMLCIVLGMICVLHPSGRRERARPEQYGD